MIWVFEDKSDDLLSILFQNAYSCNNFVYAEGNGKLVKTIENLLDKTSESIIVFLDVVPDNLNSVRIYRSLRKLSRKNNDRCVDKQQWV